MTKKLGSRLSEICVYISSYGSRGHELTKVEDKLSQLHQGTMQSTNRITSLSHQKAVLKQGTQST